MTTSKLKTQMDTAAADNAPSGNWTTLEAVVEVIANASGGGSPGTPSANVVSVQGVASMTPVTVAGDVSESAITARSPVIVGGAVSTAPLTTLVNNDACRLKMTTSGALIEKPYSNPENDWSYVAASGGIVNTTTAVTIKAAAAGTLRNYITAVQVSASALTTGSELAIRDGAGGTVLWRIILTTAGVAGQTFTFPTPLVSTAATLLEVVTLTQTGVTGATYVNVQGYTAP